MKHALGLGRQKHEYLLQNVQLVDVAAGEVKEKSVLHIRDGLVEGVYSSGENLPRVAECMDGQGRYALPGLIDLHVHLVWDGSPSPLTTMRDEGVYQALGRGVANAQASLAQGVTTVRDVGSVDNVAVDIMALVDRGVLLGPDVVAAGSIIQPTGGHVPELGHIADSPDELVKAVRTMKARGAAAIKVASTGGAYGPEEIGPSLYSQKDLEIIVREAHRLGMKVASHSLGKVGIENAVCAGVDTIEHGADIADEVLQLMKRQGTFLVPTLAVYKKLSESSGEIPEAYVEKSRTVTAWHQDTFRRAMALGVGIALGTDAGSPNFGPHPSVFVEMQAMEAYGMKAPDILRCATCAAAKALGREATVGSLEEGKQADLLLVKENPLQKLAALFTDKKVIAKGVAL